MLSVLLFIVVLYHHFYQLILFLTTFKNFIQCYPKKKFSHKFCFFNKFTPPSSYTPLTAKIRLEYDKSFLLMVPWCSANAIFVGFSISYFVSLGYKANEYKIGEREWSIDLRSIVRIFCFSWSFIGYGS